PGGEARRPLPDVASNLEALRRSAEKHRNVRAIIDRAATEPTSGSQLLGQIGDLTKDLTADAAAQMLFELGQRYHRSGHTELAADTFELLVERHPQHPLAGAAQVWLLQCYSSSEVAWRLQAAQRVAVQPATALMDPRDLVTKKVVPAGSATEPQGA